MEKNRFTTFCLKGLERAYLPSEHVFAFSRRFIDGKMVHVRDRNQEYRFTMNALMGLHRARSQGSKVFLDIEADYHAMIGRVEEQANSTEDIAATFWTGRCIDKEIPPKVASLVHDRLRNASRIKHLSAKGLAWLIAGCLTGGEEYHKNASALARLAAERYIHSETALVREVPAGLRRDWASFGAQSYMAYAFLLLARKTESTWARELGLRIARKLVQLQGPEGQWGWMYHVPTGRVADYYPVYSVHQYAYVPFFMVEAIDQGFDEFRKPLVRGFRWILGKNEMAQSMVEPTHQLVWRRLIRSGPNAKLIKIIRGMATVYCELKSSTKGANAVQIDRQCWGFEMALPLYVFSGRSDFSEILDDSSFSSGMSQ